MPKVTFAWISQTGRKSEVWNYFLRGSDNRSAKCGVCGIMMTAGGQSTSTFIKHLKKHDINVGNYESANEPMEEKLQAMTYNDPSWVKKSDEDGPASICILCGENLATADQLKEKYVISKDGTFVKVEADKSSPSQESAEQKLQVFKAVCKQLQVGTLGFQQWDFREEDLPFCTGCKKTAENLYKYQVQMDDIKNNLLKIQEDMKSKIEESEKTAFVDDLEHQLIVQARMTTFRSYTINASFEKPSSETEDNETEAPEKRRSLRKRRAKSVESVDDDEDSDSSSEETNNKPSRTRKRQQTDNDSDPEVVLSSDEEGVDERRPKRSKPNSKNSSSEARSWDEMQKEIVDKGNGNYSYREVEFVLLDHLYVCRGCPGARSYNTRIELLSHIRLEHLDLTENFYCTKCPKVFRTINALKNHTIFVHQTQNAVCGECGRKFSKVHGLRRHLFESHGLKLTIACSKCPSLFKTKDELKLHQVQVHNEKSFFCDCCGQGYDTEPELEEHKKTHESQKFFRCFHCSANFLQKANIAVHFSTKHGIHL